jgi:hypothetical protein
LKCGLQGFLDVLSRAVVSFCKTIGVTGIISSPAKLNKCMIDFMTYSLSASVGLSTIEKSPVNKASKKAAKSALWILP